MAEPGLVTLGTGLAAAAGLLKSIKDLVGAQDTKAQISQLYDIILAAQADALAANIKERTMLDRIGELEKQLTSMEAWKETKQRYALTNPHPGFFTYAMQESCKGSEPAHWICAKCYEDNTKSILHVEREEVGRKTMQVCPRCKTRIQSGGTIVPAFV